MTCPVNGPGDEWLGVRGLWQTYGAAAPVHALKGIDLAIGQRDFVALTGPSGSGKSTLLHVMCGLRTPTRGTRTICGVGEPTPRACTALRRQQVGVVFQSFHLLPTLTAWENVALGALYTPWPARRRRDAALALLERVELSDRARHLPRQLSGGEQQRVAIARAVLTQPQLLFADEPTGNLDSESGERVLDLLSMLHSEGTTIVLVTHSEVAARRARRHIALLDGAIVADDDPSGPHGAR